MDIQTIIITIVVIYVLYKLLKWYQKKQTRYIPQSVKDAVIKHYYGMCAVCSYDNARVMDYHHRKEFSDGGDNSEKNIVPLCPYHHAMITRYPQTRKDV